MTNSQEEIRVAVKIGISVMIYCLSVSAVPIYNKMIFSGTVCWSGSCARKFPYPIATAFLQLGFVAFGLGVASVLLHFRSPRARASGSSWIFGPHFNYKLRHIAPVGFSFGVKYGITNWGLSLVPTGKHLLLQSTDLVWTVIFARFINDEVVGPLEGAAISLSTLGAILISLQAHANMEASAMGLAINLLTPVFLGLCISLLRAGSVELFSKHNRLRGSMTPVEFTCIKLTISSSTAFVLSLVMENATVMSALDGKHSEAWWTAFGQWDSFSIVMLLVGSLFVMAFQVNITWLTSMASAMAVGIVGEVKVVPQWLANALFLFKVDMGWMNLAGAVCSVAGSLVYAAGTWQPHRRRASTCQDVDSKLLTDG
eukprot:TRINITY_DN44251_c0_g1_i1.p1 TRINITY_DN44251_c0_g1~~TRINITY_DN44251_c0_g1_i1.p1  ORF type:complete len:377 (-),score=49.96 TRINITY_DN44251_c0_g1_i1:109-1218(-)